MPVSVLTRTRRVARQMANSTLLPAVFPVLALAGYLIGGELPLALFALGLPVLWVLTMLLRQRTPARLTGDIVTGLMLKDQFHRTCRDVLKQCDHTGLSTVCLALEVDDGRTLSDRFGVSACDRIIDTIASRTQGIMRRSDSFARMADWNIGILLAPIRRTDLETAIQLATRLQGVVEEPIKIDGAPIYLTVSVGFCLSRDNPDQDAQSLIAATNMALDEARQNGPSAIRAYSGRIKRLRTRQSALCDQAARALDNGDIRAWFQPQISIETGKLTGMEALARWEHASRGVISPGDFLPALEKAGLLERLGEVVLFCALSTLRDLEREGVVIPTVGVNFTTAELKNPKLCDRIAWELDRFGLDADRLCVEILENVVAGAPEDMVVRNIEKLSNLGCRIDLDDFGTGHASITSLRRFPIDRIKIDRSFIVQCDRNPDQQRMVSTILTMADKLGLETLAEGVETVGEQAMLSQLGCGHVQGFGIARPMPSEKLADWITDHTARIAPAPHLPKLFEAGKRRHE